MPPTLPQSLEIVVEPAGTVWRRVCLSNHVNPIGCGFGSSRFSDPSGKNYKVLYLGSTFEVAFVEVLLRDARDGKLVPPVFAMNQLANWTCAEIENTNPLDLADLRGRARLRGGIPSDVAGARSQTLARQYSEAFHSHSSMVDGVRYPSRLSGETCIALFDRALNKLSARATPVLATCRNDLAAIITSLDLLII